MFIKFTVFPPADAFRQVRSMTNDPLIQNSNQLSIEFSLSLSSDELQR
jgi:hypothetical protein